MNEQLPNPAPEAPGRVRRRERGSALLTSMMVMVVMTVIGLSFVMVSDTENQIAVADRDARQVLYVAMSGAKLAQNWFNVPDPAYNPFVPSKSSCNLSQRVGDSDYDGSNEIDVPTNGSGDRYRGGTSTGSYRLFDKPFRGAPRDTFWGSYDHPDVLLSNDPNVPNEYLDRMTLLFNTGRSKSLEGVEITEIRVYAPPYDADLARRYGICTIACRAAKTIRKGGKVRRVSEREVTLVLQEMPFPAPGAAIEAADSVDLHGNFGVHWGGVYTEGDMALQDGSNFPGPSLPRENTSRYRFANFSPDAADLDPAIGGVQNLLTQLLMAGDTSYDPSKGPYMIEDPWINFRAVGHIVEAGTNHDDQPWPYEYTTGLPADKSIFFQNQTYSFPQLDYDFWKRFTQARTRNASYYKYAGLNGSDPMFTKNGTGTAQTFAHWVNTENPGVKPGIFFFDSGNNRNPQTGVGTLAPQMDIGSSVVDSPSGKFIMEGLVFANFTNVDSSGIAGKAVTKTINMPGEPYLDTGIDIDRSGLVGDTAEEVETINNGVWDFAYLGSTESDGQDYDAVYGTANFNLFETDVRVADGTLPNEGNDPRVVGDVVHEPFLNLAYPAVDRQDDPLFVDFDYEATVQRTMGGDRNADGVQDRMTSLRDRRGAQVQLDLIVNGIWYNEGSYTGSGNLPVYGSVLFKAGFTATGTPDIHFNEGLILGDWPPPEMKIPRVYASQVETD